jgi:hypothetical protein
MIHAPQGNGKAAAAPAVSQNLSHRGWRDG